MITATVNGEKKTINLNSTVNDVLNKLQLSLDLPFAITINNSLIPRSSYKEVHLKNGDKLDIIYPMQGG